MTTADPDLDPRPLHHLDAMPVADVEPLCLHPVPVVDDPPVGQHPVDIENQQANRLQEPPNISRKVATWATPSAQTLVASSQHAPMD